MTALITIILRWMRRDKKRTLLSFFSVLVAMYMMCFLGVYFSSAVSMLRSQEGYEHGRAHARIGAVSLEQAEQASKSSSVSESAYSTVQTGVFFQDYIDKYIGDGKTSGDALFPRLLINGRDTAEVHDTVYEGELISGDILSLGGTGQTVLHGRLPEKDGEIAVSDGIADIYGVNVGSSLTLRYEVSPGRVEYYAQQLEPTGETDVYGDPIYPDTDVPPDREFTEDKSGLFGRMLEECINAYRLNDMMHELLYGEYTFEELDGQGGTKTVYSVRGSIGGGEPVSVLEKTFQVVGRSNGMNDLTFSAGDDWARQLFHGEADCFVRISEGQDIETEVQQICETIGVEPTEQQPDGSVTEHIFMHSDLILLEGRDFGLSQSAVMLMIAGVILTAVFIFFARLIVNNAFELSSAYRAQQYAALKTVGTSNKQIFLMIMTECLIYIITALPIAIALAMVTGKAVMSKIMDIKIFDVLYGEGMTEKFFSLEMIPLIMVIIIAAAMFSVLMSGYACAIRINRLSPMEAFNGIKSKTRARRSSWFTRRHFGFAAGYAARNGARRKMHGVITLLAAVMSGVLMITLAAFVDGLDKMAELEYSKESDFDLYLTGADPDAQQTYEQLVGTDMFDRIQPVVDRIVSTRGTVASERLLSSLTDEFREVYVNKLDPLGSVEFVVKAVTREQFEKLTADISYDEFLASDGMLLSRYTTEIAADGAAAERSDYRKLMPFKDGLTEITVPADDTPASPTVTLPVAGSYTASEDPDLEGILMAIIPIERSADFFAPIDEVFGTKTVDYFLLYAKQGIEEKAQSSLQENYTDVVSNITYSITNKRTAEAIRVAGLSLAAVIFIAAMINVVSTSAAGIVNRRRELSMLRACGMSMRQVTASLVIEAFSYAAVTAGISAVAGVLLTKFFVNGILPYEASFPPIPVLIVFFTVFALMLLSYLPTLIGMYRSPVSFEMLRSE